MAPPAGTRRPLPPGAPRRSAWPAAAGRPSARGAGQRRGKTRRPRPPPGPGPGRSRARHGAGERGRHRTPSGVLQPVHGMSGRPMEQERGPGHVDLRRGTLRASGPCAAPGNAAPLAPRRGKGDQLRAASRAEWPGPVATPRTAVGEQDIEQAPEHRRNLAGGTDTTGSTRTGPERGTDLGQSNVEGSLPGPGWSPYVDAKGRVSPKQRVCHYLPPPGRSLEVGLEDGKPPAVGGQPYRDRLRRGHLDMDLDRVTPAVDLLNLHGCAPGEIDRSAHLNLAPPDRRPRPGNRESPSSGERPGPAVDVELALEFVPPRVHVGHHHLERDEDVPARRHVEGRRRHGDRMDLRASDRHHPGLAKHHLVWVWILAADDERALDRCGEPLEPGADRDGLAHAAPGYVPCSHERRYSRCSAVSSSISIRMARSFSVATSPSISAGTG